MPNNRITRAREAPYDNHGAPILQKERGMMPDFAKKPAVS
jgi:hypothetical protein